MITQQTAQDIWTAYREIRAGEALLEEMEKAAMEYEGRKDEALLKDTFGRVQHLQLGIPSSDTSRRLIDVRPQLAVSVIRAHIADKQRDLVAANERARIEIESAPKEVIA